jgi:hypothetical protein
MKALLAALVLICGVTLSMGCKSHHEEGVTSNMHSQWATVSSDPATTTGYAKDVLMDMGLKDVTGSSTAVDGMAMGKKADGTKVHVAIKKVDAGSQVSVTVGTMGDPDLGAQIVSKIKAKAGGM